MTILFVYGTLRKGEMNSHYLDNSLFLGTDYVKGFVMGDLGPYPMAFETGLDTDRIIIEVYSVDNHVLKKIDQLEGYEENDPHSYYLRKTAESGSGKSGYIYYGPDRDEYSGFGIVAGGDWKKRKQS